MVQSSGGEVEGLSESVDGDGGWIRRTADVKTSLMGTASCHTL